MSSPPDPLARGVRWPRIPTPSPRHRRDVSGGNGKKSSLSITTSIPLLSPPVRTYLITPSAPPERKKKGLRGQKHPCTAENAPAASPPAHLELRSRCDQDHPSNAENPPSATRRVRDTSIPRSIFSRDGDGPHIAASPPVTCMRLAGSGRSILSCRALVHRGLMVRLKLGRATF